MLQNEDADKLEFEVFQKDAKVYVVAKLHFLNEMIPAFETDNSFDQGASEAKLHVISDT